MQQSSQHSDPLLTEHDYIGLSETSSAPPTEICTPDECQPSDLGLDLGLGLGLGPATNGLSAPWLPCDADDKSTLECGLPADLVAKNDASKWGFHLMCGDSAPLRLSTGKGKGDANAPSKHQKDSSFLPAWAAPKTTAPPWLSAARIDKKLEASFGPERRADASFKPEKLAEVSDHTPSPPPPKDQMIGWPPVRSYRRQTLDKPAEMFVKVNMDGITVGRKVDLNAYSSYEGLRLALVEMFQPSTTVAPQAREKHFLQSGESEFVLTYEDKDGDWMLVGDVPWSMFVSSVKRLRITRGSEANIPSGGSEATIPVVSRAPSERSRFFV